jgi:hypothetical protein
MPIIVVTRLRLRDSALLDEFFTAAAAVLEQAKISAGNLGANVLADADTHGGPSPPGKDGIRCGPLSAQSRM